MASKDINLVGAVFYGVPQVDLPINGGGTASFVEISDTTATAADVKVGTYFYTASGQRTEGTASGGGGDAWSWAGKNPTVVKTYTDKKFLKDTAFNTWTPTTTATVLSSAADAGDAYTGSIADYDYPILFRWHTHFEYGSGATGKAEIQDHYTVYVYDVYGYSDNLSRITSGVHSASVGSATVPIRHGTFYKSSSTGAAAYAANLTYGVYPNTAASPTVSGSTITPRIPQINARCNNSYFNTTNAAAVDRNTSYYEYQIDIIRVDKGTSNNGNAADAIRDMWLNGIS